MRHNNITLTWKLPARIVKAWESTMTLPGGCNRCRADVLRDIARLQKRKTFTPVLSPLPEFIEQVRIGSHEDIMKWTANDGKEYQCPTIITDYKSVFKDCLPGKTWLKQHAQDELPEPTIEITATADGKTLSVNGSYKSGTIKRFMANYCRPGEGKIRLVKVK